MIRDIQFEAAVLRAGMLVGLVHEREVPGWALDALAAATGASSLLSDVVLAPTEFSAMREALRPIAEGVDAERVIAALLVSIAIVAPGADRSESDRVRILGHLRREYVPALRIGAAIKDFEDRAMLAAAGVRGVTPASADELALWLAGMRSVGYFVFTFEREEEAAAFVGALSRKVVRDREWRDMPDSARAWVAGGSAGEPYTIVLNERAWQVAAREFGPLPLASRIPYSTLPGDSKQLLDEIDATPLGIEEAQRMIAG